jgi:hypothetical protein
MDEQTNEPTRQRNGTRRFALWIVGAVSVLLIVLLTSKQRQRATVETAGEPAVITSPEARVLKAPTNSSFVRNAQRTRQAGVEMPPELVVSNKVVQFAKNRRAVAHALARRAKVEVPADVERFFDSLEAGNFADAEVLCRGWIQERRSGEVPSVPQAVWPAVMETFGVAEIAQKWPADKLLEYGEAVVGALRPGMVYVGGTDPGRYIPTLLSETSQGERHIVLTQNAFADGTYLDYINFLHNDRLQPLTKEDSQLSFQEYLRDAQARLASNQLRPGENVKVTDGRVQVSGQVAVMSINELLLNRLMEKNPDLRFALEESFSLKSTYQGALPLGPIMELRASQELPSREQVTASVEQWRAMAQNVSGDAPNSEVRKTYSHMAQAQGNLFAEQGFTAEAEQAWLLAREMAPANPEAVGSLYRLWKNGGRADEAEAMLNAFARDYPGQSDTVATIRAAAGLALQ